MLNLQLMVKSDHGESHGSWNDSLAALTLLASDMNISTLKNHEPNTHAPVALQAAHPPSGIPTWQGKGAGAMLWTMDPAANALSWPPTSEDGLRVVKLLVSFFYIFFRLIRDNQPEICRLYGL